MIRWKNWILPILFLIIINILVFLPLTKTFYEQDEWMALGNATLLGPQYLFSHIGSPIDIILAKGRILSSVINYLFLTYSTFDLKPVAFFVIFLHVLNTVLVYLFAKKIIKSVLPATLAALFFALSQVSGGAITWLVQAIGTVPATTLIIMSTFAFWKALESTGKKYLKWLLLSLVLVYLSLHFKEIGYPLLIFFPLAAIISRFKSLRNIPKLYWFIGVIALGFIFIRLVQIGLHSSSDSLLVSGSILDYYRSLIVRVVMYPLTSFSLIYVPSEVALNIAKRMTNLYYPFFPPSLFDLLSQTIVLDLLAAVLTLLMMAALYFLAKNTTKEEKLRLLFLIGFVLVSFLPYIVISKSYAYLESRYYYLATFPAGVILGYVFYRLTKIINLAKPFTISVLTLAFGLFILLHGIWLTKDINSKVLVGEERRALLSELSFLKPTLTSQRSVLYINGDWNYYITQGNPIPMQQGMGYTLMVWYYNSGQIPASLIKDKFLWDLGSQGYREVDGKGFGYFWDREKLQELIKKEHLRAEEIVSLEYNSKNKTLSLTSF